MRGKYVSQGYIALYWTVAAFAILSAWSQPWAVFSLDAKQVPVASLSVTGQNASMLPAGYALVAIAGALLLLTARKPLAYALSAIVGLVGVGVTSFTVSFMANPLHFALSLLAVRTGIADATTLSHFVRGTSIQPIVALASLGGLALIASGLLALVSIHRWPTKRSRFERQQAARDGRSSHSRLPESRVDDWDDLTRGDDPTA